MDTGRSINLMFYFLYNSLANNQEIQIDDIATVTGIIEGNQTSFDVYILKDTSHPLILVTVYLRSNGVILNFNSLSVNFSKLKIVYPNRLNPPPNSEFIDWGKVPQYVCGSKSDRILVIMSLHV
jgi:hypothetical protein